MKNKFKLFLVFSLLLSFSCGKKEDKVKISNDNFFDVVYESIAVREAGRTEWTLTDGSRDVKFDTTTKVGDDEELPNYLEGTFKFVLNEYSRSQAIAPCSGGWNGTFIVNMYVGQQTVSGPAQDPNGNYNVLDPYDPSGGVVSVNPEDLVEEIKTYIFDNIVKNVELYPQETCAFPFTTHSLKVVRFPNGTLIMEDTSKALEYFYRPKLRTER